MRFLLHPLTVLFSFVAGFAVFAFLFMLPSAPLGDWIAKPGVPQFVTLGLFGVAFMAYLCWCGYMLGQSTLFEDEQDEYYKRHSGK